MDAKITKVRLSRLLSYDWLKIVGTALALILVWAFVFNITATAITPAQKFGVCNYLGNVEYPSGFHKSYAQAYSENIFSDEVLETTASDLPASRDVAADVLQARLAMDEVDAMFVSQQADVRTAYTVEGTDPTTGEKTTETKYRNTYLETFLASYRFSLHDLSLDGEKSFFKQMENYLNKYYTKGYEDASSLNEEKVEEDFLARIKYRLQPHFLLPPQVRSPDPVLPQRGDPEVLDRARKSLYPHQQLSGRGAGAALRDEHLDGRRLQGHSGRPYRPA